MKFCPKCELTKELSLFPKNKSRPDGLHCYCKSCNNTNSRKYRKSTNYQKQYYQQNKDYYKNKNQEYKVCKREEIYIQRKNYGLLKMYGISFEEKIEMCRKQGYRCKICDFSFNEKELVIDHNHTTKEVRGLLCSNCNKGIGLLKENKEILLRAIKYL